MKKKHSPIAHLSTGERAELLAELDSVKAESNGTIAGVAKVLGQPAASIYWMTTHPVTERAADRLRRAIAKWRAKQAVTSTHREAPRASSELAPVPPSEISPVPTSTMRVSTSVVAEYNGDTRRESVHALHVENVSRARHLVSCWGFDAVRFVMSVAQSDGVAG